MAEKRLFNQITSLNAVLRETVANLKGVWVGALMDRD